MAREIGEGNFSVIAGLETDIKDEYCSKSF